MSAPMTSVTQKKLNAQEATYLSRNLKIKDVFPYKLKLKAKVKKDLNLLCNNTEFIEFIFERKLTEFLLPRTNILDSSLLDNGASSC